MAEDVVRHDELLHREADTLLYERGLLSVLQRYGRPQLTGSYTLGLMTWRDLDLDLVTDDVDLSGFFALGSTVALVLDPVRMHFRNERRAQTPGLPAGLYWGIYLGDTDGLGWKIDLWAITSDEHRSRLAAMQALEARLTPASRQAILG